MERVRRGRKPGPQPKVDWDNDPLLGKVSDAELAEMRGCSRQNVAAARRSRGIERWKEFHGPGLEESIMKALANRYENLTLPDIYFKVINDYGGVSEHTVKRKLARMVQDGLIDVAWDGTYLNKFRP